MKLGKFDSQISFLIHTYIKRIHTAPIKATVSNCSVHGGRRDIRLSNFCFNNCFSLFSKGITFCYARFSRISTEIFGEKKVVVCPKISTNAHPQNQRKTMSAKNSLTVKVEHFNGSNWMMDKVQTAERLSNFAHMPSTTQRAVPASMNSYDDINPDKT